jgi:hypothetical protein
MADICPAILSLDYCKIDSSYIRPDKGVAIMPVLFTIPLFLVQCFSLFTRLVFDWRDSQLLSHIIAFGGIVLSIVAYHSTHLSASEIFIWTPVSLIVDVGTIMHLIVITREDPEVHYWLPRWAERIRWRYQNDYALDNIPVQRGQVQQPLLNGNNAEPARKGKKRTTFIFILSHVWILTFIVLQIIALVFAIRGLIAATSTTQSWCSPAFQLGNEVFNAECVMFNITQDVDSGIGCVQTPSGPTGDQTAWLAWTAVALALQLILEIGDGYVLLVPRPLLGRKAAKIRQTYTRPVLTMVSGLFVMFAMIVFGWLQMTGRPTPLGEDFLGIRSGTGSNFTDCRFNTLPGGLRGTLLAWCDGIFDRVPGYNPS